MTDPRLKEFERVYAGRFFGKRRAVVKDIADPKRLQRVRVICPSIYGEDLSPWCAACTPMAGSIDSGASWIPQKDSHVWIEFEEGNPGLDARVVHEEVESSGLFHELAEHPADLLALPHVRLQDKGSSTGVSHL